MVASASANELSVETRRVGAHSVVIVTGRVTVDSSPHLRPVLHEAIDTSVDGFFKRVLGEPHHSC